MFIVKTPEGKYYGPFKTADDAAAHAVGWLPEVAWLIIKLQPLGDD